MKANPFSIRFTDSLGIEMGCAGLEGRKRLAPTATHELHSARFCLLLKRYARSRPALARQARMRH